ncbi:Kynurenine/alpha-aminoadipate aminotransferase, mitochondrial [Trametes pubescens]|uniref:Kynurenine/alpha-aminoadipate aminotransferase, mitochondrial n=1 Tax=Trametes pubescens TaxID=154538 RepID=A0A1M2VID9_TRAPU|nr:Kynurenine/alpha-aminoadipate aminotransferase, mitochondrial [Trametes pubescens]
MPNDMDIPPSTSALAQSLNAVKLSDSPLESRVLPREFYDLFLSESSKRRIEDPIRALLPLEDRPGLISLLAGKPNVDTFPITSMQFNLRDPVSSAESTIVLTEGELAKGLQYSSSAGIPDLLDWLVGLQEYNHGRKRGEGWGLCFGTGSSDLIYKAVNALLDPGDVALIEAPIYAGVFPVFHGTGCEMIEVRTDEHGTDAQGLREMLENWPAGKPKPKVLYTVPYGCNPTGMTSTLERRLQVLELAREHNFLILEGNAPRPPSYFTLEQDQPEVGRVVRFDSLSKVLSSGMRIGFISAPQCIIDAVILHTMTSNLQPPTLTQVIALRLLREWGYDGLRAHVERVAQFYHAKRDVFEGLMRKHLDGLAEWATPEAGMFFWFKLNLGDAAQGDSEAVIRTKALEKGVLALPGTVFHPGGRKTAYVRASFSLLPEDQVEEALRRLREVILEARKEAGVTE